MMFCSLVHFENGSNAGEKEGYCFNRFNVLDENGDTDLEKMDSEMNRVIETFQILWDKWQTDAAPDYRLADMLKNSREER